MRAIAILVILTPLLIGCAASLKAARPCHEPDYATFAKTVDDIIVLRSRNQIDHDIATDMLAIEALTLRKQMLEAAKCR